ncbi:MAG: hypothetical protein ABI863_01880 [Ginsengibacter sp.]
MKSNFITTLFIRLCFFFTFLTWGCNPKIAKNTISYSDADVIGTPYKKTDQISIDIYVDATTSMEGFAVNNSSKYSQFLDQLEASGMSAWKNADIKFFKFGQIIKPIDRNQFLTAKNDLQFYRDPAVFKDTYIDSVVKNTDSKRLSVLITDLFQTEGDVNTMVEKIKEKCFANNIAVGIVGIKTDFKGTVYDVPGQRPYALTTTERPFYAIIFGNNDNLNFLFDILKTKSFVNEDQVFIFSKYIIESFKPSLLKTSESKFVNNMTKPAADDMYNVFDFNILKGGKEAHFDLKLDLKRRKRAADFLEKNLEVIAFRKSSTGDKSATAHDSIATNDISIENIKRNGDVLTATLLLNNQEEAGNYSYIIYLKPNELSGLQMPKWIRDFSTENPVPGTPSASQTLNLEKLSSRLLLAQASISPIYIAKLYINIFKH